MGSQRVRHDWATKRSNTAHACFKNILICIYWQKWHCLGLFNSMCFLSCPKHLHLSFAKIKYLKFIKYYIFKTSYKNALYKKCFLLYILKYLLQLFAFSSIRSNFTDKPVHKIPCLHYNNLFLIISSVQFSRSVISYYLQPRGLQHARPHCPSTTPGAYSNSCPSCQWCHPTVSSSVVALILNLAIKNLLNNKPCLITLLTKVHIVKAMVFPVVRYRCESWTMKKAVKSFSHVLFFATPWTVAYQAPLSMGFSSQEYWSGLPFPSPGDLPNPGIKARSPALQADALLSEPPRLSTNELMLFNCGVGEDSWEPVGLQGDPTSLS